MFDIFGAASSLGGDIEHPMGEVCCSLVNANVFESGAM